MNGNNISNGNNSVTEVKEIENKNKPKKRKRERNEW